MAQFLRPDGLISAGTWTGNHTAIDETTPVDSDLAYSQNNPNGSIFEISLNDPGAAPGVGTTTVRYRHGQVRTGVLNGSGSSTNLDVTVYQGAVLIASDTQQNPSGTWTTRVWTPDLSGVTDWNDVRLRFVASGGGGSPANRRGVGVSWVELEVPDGVVGITGSLAATESGNDVASMNGTVAWPLISGSLAATESGNDVFTGSGVLPVSGSLAATESGNDVFTGSGNVGTSGITGSLIVQEIGSDQFTASGELIIGGSASNTFDISGDAFGLLHITGSTANSLSVDGTADGSLSVDGTILYTVDLTGIGLGDIRISGQSSDTVDLTGIGLGDIRISGQSSDVVLVTGTAFSTDEDVIIGQASDQILLIGVADAKLSLTGLINELIITNGVMIGETPISVNLSDFVTVTHQLTGDIKTSGLISGLISTAGSSGGFIGQFIPRLVVSSSKSEKRLTKSNFHNNSSMSSLDKRSTTSILKSRNNHSETH